MENYANQNMSNLSLQKTYNMMSDEFQLQHINAYHQLTPQSIDHLVDAEMKHIKSNYHNEEQHYVEQMLQEQPIIVERRTPMGKSVSSSDESRGQDAAAQQRAESCRKSRINNKVKKAKTKFRHKFVSNKLAQSAHVLDSIRDLIAQTEAQLLRSGCNPLALQKMRNTFGIDRSSCVTHNVRGGDTPQ